ncbi:glycosyltransferase, partial [bacterium]|nr:glycosyltransferase [bacterium]
MKLGINASRAHSGGALAHLIGILSEANPAAHGFSEVHVWSYRELLESLPDKPWLTKHCPPETQQSMLRQLWWERFDLPKELKGSRCDVLLNVDAGTVCRFWPAVTMSRDMLSYEPGEMQRYGFGKARLRLSAIKFVQNASLRAATGAIFLTRYASTVIQQSSGSLRRVAYIPHGVSECFRAIEPENCWPMTKDNIIRCLYVSNIAPYKHQWHVVRAIKLLRTRGFDLRLTLTGGGQAGGSSTSQARLDREIALSDPQRAFVEVVGFVKQEELPRLLKKAELFVFASSCENMPNTLIEAMASGLPIACSNR